MHRDGADAGADAAVDCDRNDGGEERPALGDRHIPWEITESTKHQITRPYS